MCGHPEGQGPSQDLSSETASGEVPRCPLRCSSWSPLLGHKHLAPCGAAEDPAGPRPPHTAAAHYPIRRLAAAEVAVGNGQAQTREQCWALTLGSNTQEPGLRVYSAHSTRFSGITCLGLSPQKTARESRHSLWTNDCSAT